MRGLGSYGIIDTSQTAPSYSGLVRRPLTAVTRVRIPLGTPSFFVAKFVLLAVSGLLIAGFARAEDPPFSHKQHVRRGIACPACHPSPAPGRRMTTIPASRCGACHRSLGIRTTSNLSGWERVYELPREVRFHHKQHARASCSTCHGSVEQRDLAVEEFPLNMAFCRECHISSGAKAECGTCHRVK